MGMNLDTGARKKKILEENAQNLAPLKMYTLTEIEPILGVTHRTLMSYCYSGALKARKVGGKWRVTEEALREFIYSGVESGTRKK